MAQGVSGRVEGPPNHNGREDMRAILQSFKNKELRPKLLFFIMCLTIKKKRPPYHKANPFSRPCTCKGCPFFQKLKYHPIHCCTIAHLCTCGPSTTRDWWRSVGPNVLELFNWRSPPFVYDFGRLEDKKLGIHTFMELLSNINNIYPNRFWYY